MGELANAMARRSMGSGGPPPVPFSAPAPSGVGMRSPPPRAAAPMPGPRTSLPGRPGAGAPPIPGKVRLVGVNCSLDDFGWVASSAALDILCPVDGMKSFVGFDSVSVIVEDISGTLCL